MLLKYTFLLYLVYHSILCGIYRSSCRRYGLFKLYSRNVKLTGSVQSASYAKNLSKCAKKCSELSTCKTLNFKKATSQDENNCELLGNTKTSNTFESHQQWNFYETVVQTASPACMTLDGTPMCSAGYICVEVCNSANRYRCEDINECASSPCVHGWCENLENMYRCHCNGGWTGTRCSQDINECASSPCQNDGTCHNNLNSYSCSCTIWYGGANCEKLLGIGKK